ncbi:hypothetical protein [Leptospira alexanderi]|uniref:Lipoprotein n=1 Tax=Leptospira alexanderi serovar Manhao 3 str. L 60 TaxID=1049759 RepID=V6IFU8_9LEPT|nr:hypothetical protein [Leptospira alexanderi]EQA63948.1 putative lipoprotein [Leptospira alexanderi serovar Manhao 3 str. L 60]
MRILFIAFLISSIFGCLQFSQRIETENDLHEEIQTQFGKKICFEFESRQINGKQIGHSENRYDSALEERYYRYEQIIRSLLIEKASLYACGNDNASNSKILISFNWNIKPDCINKNVSEEFNGCRVWNFVSGLTFGVIPFWGPATSEIALRLNSYGSKKYQYNPRVYTIISVFLLPIFWINVFYSAPEESIRQSIELFLMESGLSRTSDKPK